MHDDSVIIGDLGISKENVTNSSTNFVGTIEYMSPEIIDQNVKFDKKFKFSRDIWYENILLKTYI